MNYGCTLIAVTNMANSKRFYCEVLGLAVVDDFGANVTLTGNIALQTADSWRQFIGRQDLMFGGNVFELYFEEKDFDGFLRKLDDMPNIEYVHPVQEQPWGQRCVRFYDPDRHIIEVGEHMDMVVKRFLDSGLTIEETAKRMDVPVEYIRANLP